MASLATSRLISASAGLDPADRALLDLWVNRGLDDDRLARLAGLTPDALHRRRDRIVERLSEDLGLPAAHVRSTLSEIVAASAPTPAPANGHAANGTGTSGHPPGAPVIAPAPTARNGTLGQAERVAGLLTGPAALRAPGHSAVAGLYLGPAALHGPPPAPRASAPPAVAGLYLGPAALHGPPADAVPQAADAPPPPPGDGAATAAPAPARRRRSLWIGAAILAAAVAAVVVALASGGSTPRHRAASGPASTAKNASASATTPTGASSSATTPATTATGASATATTPVTPARGAPGAAATLAGLPGGLSGSRGSVTLIGAKPHFKLRLTVSSLPAPRSGRYEAWLYNSILDSRPLGHLHAGAGATTFALPAGAGRFRWIDISRQPPGSVNHSGESQLRAPNPAHGVRAEHPGRRG